MNIIGVMAAAGMLLDKLEEEGQLLYDREQVKPWARESRTSIN